MFLVRAHTISRLLYLTSRIFWLRATALFAVPWYLSGGEAHEVHALRALALRLKNFFALGIKPQL